MGNTYKIYDRKSFMLIAEGELKEKDGKYVIERIVPDSQNAVIFVNGKEMRIAHPPKQEVMDMDQIKETYWTYGEKNTPLQDKRDGGEDVIWQSKYYGDLNFHVVAKDGNNGKMLKLVLETDDGRVINLRKVVSENNVVFINVFKK